MDTFSTIISVLQVICAIALTAVVLFQSSKQAGLSGAIGGGSETFFGKGKARTLDAKLSTATKFLAFIFIVLTLLLNIL